MELKLLYGLLEIAILLNTKTKIWGFCIGDKYCYTSIDGFEKLV